MITAFDLPAIQRTGPALVQDCHLCEGVGRPGCPRCLGTGKTVKDIHPFVTLEALQEHIGGIQSAIGISFEDLYGDGVGGPKPPAASQAVYHLRAIAEYAQSLFQQLVLLLPEEWERTEGSD